jgi:hypothetical protein
MLIASVSGRPTRSVLPPGLDGGVMIHNSVVPITSRG